MPFLADIHPLERAHDSAADRALDAEFQQTCPAGHTAGPWEAVGNLVRTCRKEDGRGGFLVAECPANIGNRIQDARLIAAAPELLEALTDLIELAAPVYTVRCEDGSEITHPWVKAARAAIAKATGSDK